jgi:hypothetical protein
MVYLEDISFLGRVAIAVVTILLTVVAILILEAAEGQESAPPTSQYEERLTQLDREAIEEAYKKHINTLFEYWVKDQAQQPARAIRGATAARSAFTRSMNAIEQREKQLLEMRPK